MTYRSTWPLPGASRRFPSRRTWPCALALAFAISATQSRRDQQRCSRHPVTLLLTRWWRSTGTDGRPRSTQRTFSTTPISRLSSPSPTFSPPTVPFFSFLSLSSFFSFYLFLFPSFFFFLIFP